MELSALSCVVKEFEMNCCMDWTRVRLLGYVRRGWMINRSFYRRRSSVNGVHQVICCMEKEGGLQCYSPHLGLSPVLWRTCDVFKSYTPCSEKEGKELWVQACRDCGSERLVVVEGSYLQILSTLQSCQTFGFVPHLCRVLLNGKEVGRGLRINVEMACELKRLDETKRNKTK